jgi:hypothetical protein
LAIDKLEVGSVKQFCEEVLKFLRSEYNDSYQFEVKCWLACPPHLMVPNNEKAELTITMSPCYKLVIVNDSMQYLLGWYLSGDYIVERNQYRWQKELIDMIEGG